MKLKISFFLFLLLSGTMVHSQGTWVQKSSLPGTTRMGGVAFSIGNKGYMGIGGDFFGAYYVDFWEYDPATDTWTQKADFASNARYRALGFGVGSKGYICTGYDGTAYNDMWEYDTTANAWTAKASMGIAGRFGAAGFAIGTKIYVGTGTAAGYMNDLWEYDTGTNTWTQKANFGGQPKIYGTAFSVGANGYLGTGGEISAVGIGTNDIWEYDTTANSWTQKNNYPGTGVSEAVTFTIGNYAYLGTGTSNWGAGAVTELWKYDPSNDNWWQVASFPGTAREEGAAFAIGCKGYFGSGFTDDNNATLTNDLWEYTPDSACSVQPVAVFTAPNHICPGTCTNFTNLSLNGVSFEWTFTGASPSTSTDVNPTTICYNTPGTYSVSLIATNASGSDTLTLNNFITVYPYPAPQGISQNGDTLFANAGAVSYQWYHSGNIIPGATDYFYLADTSGDFNVVATDANGCEVEAAIFDVVASVQSEVGNSQFAIFPNPVADKLAIYNLQIAINTISIYNLLGKKVLVVQSEFQNQKSEMNTDVSLLATGMYWLEIKSEGKIFYTKFVKQ